MCGDREEAPDEDAEAVEPVEGVAAHLLPDRVTFAETGEPPVGLYFDEQVPGFVPVPEDSEIAMYLPEALIGLTNAEMQDAFGISFGGALTPETTMPDARISGGLIGPAPPPFAGFPPELEPLIALRDPELDEDRDCEEEDGPVIDPSTLAKLYVAFYGRLPDDDGFDYWLDAIARRPETDLAEMAARFAAAPEFEALHGGATAEEIVTDFYQRALGRLPGDDGLAFWAETLRGDGGLGVVGLGLAFALSDEVDRLHGAEIDEFLDRRAGEMLSRPDGETIYRATAAADVFVFPDDAYAIVTAFDPETDRIDIAGLGTPDDIEVMPEGAGTTLLLGDGDLFLPDVDAARIDEGTFVY